MSIDPVVAAALRSLLALLFAAAAAHKLADLVAFRIVLHDYHVLPPSLVTPATALVIATELGLAAALPWRATAPLASTVACALLAVYSVAIAANLLRGRRTLECGCAPSAYRQPLSEWLLVRNLALMAAALSLRVPIDSRPLSWLDAFTFGGLVAAGVAIWTAAQHLAALSASFALARSES